MPRSMVAIQSETPPSPPGYDHAGRHTSSWLVSNNSGTEGRIYWDGAEIAYRSNDGTTYFDHKDWIGTERMRTNSTGAVASSYVSLPWGDGYTATVQQSGGDQDSLHFGQLDHDAESSTEHAQFRQYSSVQGRWMSPDPYGGSYDMTNPQSMNRYAYVLNSPLSYVDPTGLNKIHPCAPFCGGNGSPGSTTDPNFSFSPGGAGGTVWSTALNGQAIVIPSGTQFGQITNTGQGDDGTPIYQVSVINLYSLFYWMSSSSMPSTSSTSSGYVAPNNNCMAINGKTVCPSPIDNKYSLDNAGQRDYRENKPGCNLHVAVNNQTGQINNRHMDGYNPNYQLFNHLFLDWLPDKIYDLTGQYLIPAGRTFCQ